jgi:hypothetical protein
MRSQAFAEATLALFGLCVFLAPMEAAAQSVPATPVPASAQSQPAPGSALGQAAQAVTPTDPNAQSVQALPEPPVATSKPGVRMVRQPLPGGTAAQSPTAFKEPTRKKESWMERHKVLTAIIFAVVSVFAGGTER